MDEKRKRSDEPELELTLKTLADEHINKLPTLDEAMNFELEKGNVDPSGDYKKLRRTVSNRLSAQRARIRRTGYTVELEKKVKDLQDTIASVVSGIENEKSNLKMLRKENEMLQQHLDNVTDKSKLRSAQIEGMKVELKRLKELEKSLLNDGNMEIEGENTTSYIDVKEETDNMDQGIEQYLNLDAINFDDLPKES